MRSLIQINFVNFFSLITMARITNHRANVKSKLSKKKPSKRVRDRKELQFWRRIALKNEKRQEEQRELSTKNAELRNELQVNEGNYRTRIQNLEVNKKK